MRLLRARVTRGSTRSEVSALRSRSGQGWRGQRWSGQRNPSQSEDLPLGDREREVLRLVRPDPLVLGIMIAFVFVGRGPVRADGSCPSRSRADHQHRTVHRLEMGERMTDLRQDPKTKRSSG